MTQLLTVSASNSEAAKQATYYLKVYNRLQSPLTFGANKTAITKRLLHAKDETIVILERNIDDTSRRSEIIQHILSFHTDSACQPHNTVIFSPHAHYLLPSESRFCLTLPDDFSVPMTAAEEQKLCHALDCLTRYCIDRVCSTYSDMKETLSNEIHSSLKDSRQFPDLSCKTSYALMYAVMQYFYADFSQVLDLNSLEALLYSVMTPPTVQSGASTDPIVNEWISLLNDAIIAGSVQITLHSKQMNYRPKANQLIVKNELLLLEEETVSSVFLPKMRTTDSVHRLLKALDEHILLHATKKDRFPLTVYQNGSTIRPSFIAVYREGLLSYEAELMIEAAQYADWFAKEPRAGIPIITNPLGWTAYQPFDFERAANLHCFAIGNSGSGKTHALTERMCSLQKLHHPIIIFDTSDSFTEEEIVQKLSADGDPTTAEKVRRYVKHHITFHNIEDDGLPVDLLKFDYPSSTESTVRMILSILEAHNSNMGKRQRAALYAAVKELVSANRLTMGDLYARLTSEDLSESLVIQFREMLSCFVEFGQSDQSWGECIAGSKDIVIISTHAVSSSGGSGLIDMLLMSLFYYQKTRVNQHLSIFIDEIKKQNLNSRGPIAHILTEGRKYHIGLNFATQFLPDASSDVTMIMENADLKIFFQLDGKAASTSARQLGVKPNELTSLDIGACYVKGTLWNHSLCRPKSGIIQGRTFRNFVR